MGVHIWALIASSLASQALGHVTLVEPDPRGQDGNLWYQVGCQIGCACSGASSKELYVTPATFGCPAPMEPTNNAKETRSWNVDNLSEQGDYAKYNPWRAPGHAIPLNGCGIASGFLTGGFERIGGGGVKNFYQSAIPNGYKAGDPGTSVPKLQASIANWTAGSTATVKFAIDVNHGGGYQYRLCPTKSSSVSESCFQSMPLTFASKMHTIFYRNGTNFTIPAVDVTAGVKPGGSTWRRLPVPACNCDLGSGCTTTKKENMRLYKGRTATWAYSTGVSEKRCPTGLQFPKSWDDGYGYSWESSAGETRDEGKKMSPTEYNNGRCRKLSKAKCEADSKCKYYTSKSVCWGAPAEQADGGKRRLDTSHEHGAHEHRMLKQSDGSFKCSRCGYVYNPKEHNDEEFSELPESFICPRCGAPKKSFQSAALYEDALGEKPADGYSWLIGDELVVPDAPGEYVLSWRLDCEQTPQIWTNCADVQIVPRARSALEETSGSASRSSGVGAVALVGAKLLFWAVASGS